MERKRRASLAPNHANGVMYFAASDEKEDIADDGLIRQREGDGYRHVPTVRQLDLEGRAAGFGYLGGAEVVARGGGAISALRGVVVAGKVQGPRGPDHDEDVTPPRGCCPRQLPGK